MSPYYKNNYNINNKNQNHYSSADTKKLNPARLTHGLPEETKLLIDNREPEQIIQILQTIPNLTIEIVALEVGDYVVPDKLIIERKSAIDFHQSMTTDSKRLLFQANAMALTNIPSILLLEGSPYDIRSMTINSITGTLSWMTTILGIGLMPVLDMHHSAYAITTMIRHAVYGLGYDLGLREGAGKRSAHGHSDLTATYILESVPGVSANKARSLLQHFGSLVALANASENDIKAIKGFGPDLAARIYDSFNAKFSK